MRRIKLPEEPTERIKIYLIAAIVTLLTLYCLVELYRGITDIQISDTTKCVNILKQLIDGTKK